MVEFVNLLKMGCEYFGKVFQKVMVTELQVDNREDQVVAAGPDKTVPVVILIRKLGYDLITERWVFVE